MRSEVKRNKATFLFFIVVIRFQWGVPFGLSSSELIFPPWGQYLFEQRSQREAIAAERHPFCLG